MENQDEKYLKVNGEKVNVSEAVYRAYVRPVRAEQRRRRREWRCMVKGVNGRLVRCKADCKKCQYALSGQNATGNKLSLNWMKDDGVYVEDRRLDVEQNYIAKEEKQELYVAIASLTPRQKELVRLIYFENKTQDDVAEIWNVSQQAVSKALGKILTKLKSFFEIWL